MSERNIVAMSKLAKVPNYTVEQEARMREVYGASPTPEAVALLMDELGRDKRSIVAKLANMKIYVTPARTTKSGKTVIKKEDLVKQISAQCDGLELLSFNKANKLDLERLVSYLNDHFGELESN